MCGVPGKASYLEITLENFLDELNRGGNLKVKGLKW